MSASTVVVIGGGIAGLSTALFLKGSGREVVIVERDPAPPEIAPEDAFERWKRPGVPQFRHAHMFLARLVTLVRDHHPELLRELLDAGLVLSSLTDSLPASHLAGYTERPGDRDLLHLWGRRPTFELVLRRHVGRLPGVRFLHEAQVERLLIDDEGPRVRVRGVELLQGGERRELEAELVVDGSGKRSRAAEQLASHGVRVEVESHPSGFVYSCRHYRYDDPVAPRSRRDGGGNLDFLGYATFFAERGHYAITFGCPEDDVELRAAISRAEPFEALCAQFPVVHGFTSASTPVSKVLGAGAFENRWTRFGAEGGRPLLGYFAVGDAHVETNPMYGRGCAATFVQAHVLADVLRATDDPAVRAEQYEQRSRDALRPAFDLSVQTDRIYHTRAKVRLRQPVPAGERLLSALFERAWLPANERSLLVAREFIKAQQMREISPLGLRLAMTFRLLVELLRSFVPGRRALPAPTTPTRAELLSRLPAEPARKHPGPPATAADAGPREAPPSAAPPATEPEVGPSP